MKIVRIKNLGHDDILRRSRQVKRHRAFRKLAWAAGILAGLLIAAPLILNNHRLLITNVRVAGARTIDPQVLTGEINRIIDGRYGYLISKRSIWLYPRRQIEAELTAKFPTIRLVQISLNDHELIAKIVERRGVSLWCPEAALSFACYFADETGLIFAIAPSFSSQIFPIFEANLNEQPIGTRPFAQNVYEQVLKFRSELDKLAQTNPLNLGSVYRVETIAAPDLNLLVERAGETTEIFRVKIDRDQNLDQALVNLKSALISEPLRGSLEKNTEPLDYIDLRFPPKVFYKFR